MPRALSRLLLALLATLLVVTATGAPAQAEEATATLTGKVLDAKKKPVSGRDVTVVRAGGDDFWDVAGRARTTSTGSFKITGLAAGAYHVVTDDGRYPSPLPAVYWPSGGHPDEAGTVTLGAGETRALSTLTVRAAASITTNLSADSPVPADGSLAGELFRRTGADRWASIGSMQTAASGSLTWGGLAPGTYRIGYKTNDRALMPTFWKGSLTLAGATDVVVTEGQKRAGIAGSFLRSTTIGGQVTRADGSALGRAQIDVLSPRAWGDGERWETEVSARSSSTGRYSIGVRPGRYLVRISAAGHVTHFAPGVETEASASQVTVGLGTPATVDLTAVETSSLSGRVNVPVFDEVVSDSRLAVTLYRDRGEDGSPDWVQVVRKRPVSRAFTFDSLAPGRYTIGYSGTERHRPVFWGGAGTLESAEAIVVEPGRRVSGLDATLVDTAASATTGEVSGRVQVESGLEARRLTVVPFRAMQSGGQVTWKPQTAQNPARDGRFHLAALPPGTYRIELRDSDGTFVPTFVGGSELDTAADLEVVAGGALRLDPVTVSSLPALQVDRGPSIVGDAAPAKTLTVDLGDVPAAAVKQYEWFLDGESVSTGASLPIHGGMAAKRVSVVVEAATDGTRRTSFAARGPLVRPAPVRAISTSSTATTVTVDWYRSAQLEWESYVVRLTGPDGSTQESTVDSPDGRATFTALRPSTTYTTTVVGKHASGAVADPSEPVEVATQRMAEPSAGLTLVSRAKTSVTLKWAATDGAARYRIGYRKHGTSNITYVDVGSVTTRKLTGLKKNTTYWMRLEAVSIDGDRRASIDIKVKTAK